MRVWCLEGREGVVPGATAKPGREVWSRQSGSTACLMSKGGSTRAEGVPGRGCGAALGAREVGRLKGPPGAASLGQCLVSLVGDIGTGSRGGGVLDARKRGPGDRGGAKTPRESWGSSVHGRGLRHARQERTKRREDVAM